MKRLLVLPGNSPKNKVWGESAVEHFGRYFDESYVQEYVHWKTGEDIINFDTEIENLHAYIETHGVAGDTYYIFAKSFGTILTFMAAHRNVVIPTQCVFFGIPFNLVEETSPLGADWSALSTFVYPSLAFHNTHDPVASIDTLRMKLKEVDVHTIDIIEMPYDNHGYVEFDSYREHIEHFLTS